MKLGWFGKHVRAALALTGLACSLGFSQDLLYPDMFALSDVQLLDGVLKECQDDSGPEFQGQQLQGLHLRPA